MNYLKTSLNMKWISHWSILKFLFAFPVLLPSTQGWQDNARPARLKTYVTHNQVKPIFNLQTCFLTGVGRGQWWCVITYEKCFFDGIFSLSYKAWFESFKRSTCFSLLCLPSLLLNLKKRNQSPFLIRGCNKTSTNETSKIKTLACGMIDKVT